MPLTLWKIHLLSTIFMTGLIWFVQLVHYPSFFFVERHRFTEFGRQHQRFTSIVVALPMLAEGITGVALFLVSGKFHTALTINFVGLFAIWLCTVFLSMPLHEKLNSGFNGKLIERLVLTNWPRTILWSGRSALLFLMWGKFL